MPSERKKTSREQLLERQVKILADRLAILYAMFEDHAIDEQMAANEHWRAWLVCQAIATGGNNEISNKLRKQWRADPNYKHGIESVRELLRATK